MHPHSLHPCIAGCAPCNGGYRRGLLGIKRFDPKLEGYLPAQHTNPYTNRILSLLLLAPYSSLSLLFSFAAPLKQVIRGSLMLFIIADYREFVKSFR